MLGERVFQQPRLIATSVDDFGSIGGRSLVLSLPWKHPNHFADAGIHLLQHWMVRRKVAISRDLHAFLFGDGFSVRSITIKSQNNPSALYAFLWVELTKVVREHSHIPRHDCAGIAPAISRHMERPAIQTFQLFQCCAQRNFMQSLPSALISSNC